MQYIIYTVVAFWYFDHSLQTIRTMSGHMQRYWLIMRTLLVCIAQCWKNLTIICARLIRSNRNNSGFRVHMCQIHLSSSVRKQYFKHSLSIPFFRSKLPGCVSVLTALWRKYKLTLSCSYKASTHWRSGGLARECSQQSPWAVRGLWGLQQSSQTLSTQMVVL